MLEYCVEERYSGKFWVEEEEEMAVKASGRWIPG